MVNNSCKFNFFSTIVKCKIDKKHISILVDKIRGYVPFYEFDYDDYYAWIYHRYYNSEKIRDYIFHRCKLYDTIWRFSTIICDVTITFFSNYKFMTGKHKMQQPRRILESKLLKHIHNVSYNDKINKYKFLSREYNLI